MKLGVVWLVGAMALALWGLFAAQYVVFGYLGHDWVPDKLGQWGDSFGALNALFGSLGFIGLLVTLWMQGGQIRKQAEEAETARKEQHRQRFESSFFQLLSLMREARNNIKLGGSSGEGCIQNIAHLLSRSVDGAGGNLSPEIRVQSIIREYEVIMISGQNTIGRYCRVFHTILKRIDLDRVLSPSEQNDYARLLRSHLSDDEVTLIGVNGLLPDYQKFKDLVGRYKILKYSSNTIIRPALEIVYGLGAFDSFEIDQVEIVSARH